MFDMNGLLIALVVLLTAVNASAAPKGHSHNDYGRAAPLAEAIAAGVASIEVDLVYSAGRLLVCHTARECSPERTLETLYLAPLAALGADRPARLTLQIETKVTHPSLAGVAIPGVFHGVLAAFAARPELASWVDVVFIGQQYYPPPAPTPAGFSFRADPDTGLVSVEWPFAWEGHGDMPAADRSALERLVDDAHSRGARLQLSTHPIELSGDVVAVWDALADAGVDTISTDDPLLFAAWRAQTF